MADDMKRVGLSFKTDGTVDFQKSLKQISEAVQGNREEFKRAKIAWDDSTTAMEKLTDRQKYLQKQTETYNEKVEILRRELSELEGAENKNEKAMSQKKKQLSQAETTLAQYQKGLKEVNQEIKSGSAVLEENMKKLDDSISTLDASAKKNESSFKLMKSQWDKNTSSAKKLKDEQKYLTEQGETYQKKVGLVKEELKLLENAEGDNKKAIEEKKAALNEAETSLNEYKSRLKEVNEQLQFGKASIDEFAGKVEKVGEKVKSAGSKITKIGTTAVAGVATAGGKAAMELDEGYDIIISKTGASGEALEGLNDVANSVYGKLPTTMTDVGTAVGEINTKFASTGDELENLTELFVKFADINGTDLNSSIDNVNKIMRVWNVDISDTGKLLGLITQKGQQTGVSVDSLMQNVLSNNSVFKEMDLTLEQAIQLMADFEMNGVDSTTALAGLKKGLQNAVSSGVPMNQALAETIGKIKDAKTDTEALSIATELFGKKGAAEMATAIREGRINIEDLSGSMKDCGTIVEDTFDQMQDPWDKGTIAMNNLKLAGSDLAGEFLDDLMPLIDSMTEHLQNFTEWFSGLDEDTKQLIIKIGLIVAAIGPIIMILGSIIGSGSKIIGGIPIIAKGLSGLFGIIAANPVIAIITAIAIAVFALWTNCDEFREGVLEGIEIIKSVLTAGYDFCVELGEEKLGRIQDAYEKHGGGITGILAASWQAWKEVWSTGYDVIDKLTGGKLTGIKNKFWNKFEEIKNVVKNALDAVKRFFAGEWPTPKIKMPHFKISPPGWSIGDLVKGSIPRLSVNWHAKGAILNRPTVVNQSGNTIDVAGEAGPEAVTPIETLRKYVREEVKDNNTDLIKALAEVLGNLGLTMENVINLGDERIYQKVVKLTIKELNRQQTSKPVWKGGFT